VSTRANFIIMDLPCLITPDVLHFTVKSERPSPQVITIFNHHEFVIHYKILATSPQLYNIGSTQGSINPTSSMEILIELKEDAARFIKGGGSTAQDKFRVEVADSLGTATRKKVIKTTTTLARSNVTQPQLSDFIDLNSLSRAFTFMLRLFPLAFGILVIFLVTPSENFVLAVKVWLAFIVGLVCMYFYMKKAQI